MDRRKRFSITLVDWFGIIWFINAVVMGVHFDFLKEGRNTFVQTELKLSK